MLGGFLGGLANLGTAYGRGYLPAQDLYTQTLQRRQYLQSLQDQQQAQNALLTLGAKGAFDPRTQQPQPGTATPGTPPSPGPLQPLTTAPVTPVQTQALPPALPQVPSYATAFDTAAPQLGGLGGGTPSVGGMGGGTLAGSPFGPGQPFTGTAGGAGTGISPLAGFGTGLPSPRGEIAGFPSLGLGRDLPLADVPGAEAPEQPDYAMRGPPAGTDVVTGLSTLGAPTLNGYALGGAAQPPSRAPQPPSGALDFGPQIAALRAPATQRPARPQPPAAPQIADAGTAAVPGTADRGGYAQAPGTADTAVARRPPDGAGGGYGQVIQLESGGNMNIGPGSYGEIGPAQILPSTAKPYMQPGEDLYDPRTNIEIGRRYYDDLLNKSGGDYAATLVGYNRGEEAMKRFQRAGDNLDALRGTSMMPTAAYQRAIRAAGGRGGGDSAEVVNASAEMGGNLSREQHGIGDRGLQMILARMPQLPQAVQMMKPSELAQLIQQSFPGTSDAVKGAVFLKALPLMNEQAKEQTAVAWKNWNAQMEQLEFVEKVREADIKAGQEKFGPAENFIDTTTGQPVLGRSVQMPGGRIAVETADGRMLDASKLRRPYPGEAPDEARKPQPYQIATEPQTKRQYWSRPPRYPGDPTANVDQQGNPITPAGFERVGGAGRPGAYHALTITRADGKKEEIYAQIGKGGGLVDVDGNPIQFDPKTDKIAPARAAGRQAQAQIQSMINASAEASAELSNAVDLSIDATLGPFMGVQFKTPDDLREALVRSGVSNFLTADQSRSINTTFTGLGRFLAQIEATGRATGLVGLSSMSAENLTPKSGDSALNILRKYAEIRQIVERGISSTLTFEEVSDASRKQLEANLEEIRRAVPFSVRDVNALERDPTKQRVADFARRIGIAGAAERAGTAAPGAVTGGGTPDTAIATMNEQQLYQYLQRTDLTDTQLYEANQALSRIKAQRRQQGGGGSTAAPPIAR